MSTPKKLAFILDQPPPCQYKHSQTDYVQQTRDIDPMLGQRCRRLTSIGPTLGLCLVFAGYLHIDQVGLRPSSLRMGLISQLLLLVVV